MVKAIKTNNCYLISIYWRMDMLLCNLRLTLTELEKLSRIESLENENTNKLYEI